MTNLTEYHQALLEALQPLDTATEMPEWATRTMALACRGTGKTPGDLTLAEIHAALPLVRSEAERRAS